MRILILVLGMVLLANSLNARPVQTPLPTLEWSTPMDMAGEAKPLLAWSEFCARYPAECAVNPAEPFVIPFSEKLIMNLKSVTDMVHAAITPITDQEHLGVADRWDFAEDGRGDCEDFQLLKRRLLINEFGYPRRALLMTVVFDEKGEGHAVLTVRTTRGDYILDNKTRQILPWQRTGYHFIKRESQHNAGWIALNTQQEPLQTAARR